MAKEFYFVRHGLSKGNIGESTSYPSQIELTETGQQQALDIADEIQRRNIQPLLIFHSSYIRTRQTADPTIKRHPQARVEEWESTREFTYLAQFDGTKATKKDREPFVTQYWKQCDPTLRTHEKSESFQDLITRTAQTMNRIREEKESIVGFVHEQFIQALIWTLLNDVEEVTHEQMQEFVVFKAAHPIPNASLGIIDLQKKQWEVLFTPEPTPIPAITK